MKSFVTKVLLFSSILGVQLSSAYGSDSRAVCMTPAQDGFVAYILNLDSNEDSQIVTADGRAIKAQDNQCVSNSGVIYCGFKVNRIGFHNIDHHFVDIDVRKTFKIKGSSMSIYQALWHEGKRSAVGIPASCGIIRGSLQEAVNMAIVTLTQTSQK